MRYILSTLFIFTSLLGFSQEVQLITGKWMQGKIDSTGHVVEADISPGGWSSLVINEDKSIVYNGSFDCGFGSARYGKWSMDNKKHTLTFIFNQKVGFMNNPDTTKIKEKEIYTIEKNDPSMLILKNQTDNIRLAFLKTKEE